MKLSEFDYSLDPKLIAQHPITPRDNSRLLIYNRQTDQIQHARFYDLPQFLQPNDLLFINNSKVFKARVFLHKPSGGRVEVFLLRAIDKENNIWECLLRGKISPPTPLFLNNVPWAQVIEKKNDVFLIKFSEKYLDFLTTIKNVAQVPLPPYIKRDKQDSADDLNYQTVYARDEKTGSAAAPTAGLHFTEELLSEVQKKNIKILEASLHVGLGTFLPIKTDNIQEHQMHSEVVEITAQTINSLIEHKNKNGRIIAVGTTSCRILESLAPYLENNKDGKIKSYLGDDLVFSTDIFIYPGYQFKIVDSIITNFHLPKSSLLLLVSALLGREKTLDLYQEAMDLEYRFFSYGDAMFII